MNRHKPLVVERTAVVNIGSKVPEVAPDMPWRWVSYLSGYKVTNGVRSDLFSGEQVSIDYGLRKIIAEFNARGFETTACCSGLASDHKDATKTRKIYGGGYVMFMSGTGHLDIEHILPSLFFLCDENPAIRLPDDIGDEIREKSWKDLLRQIRRYL